MQQHHNRVKISTEFSTMSSSVTSLNVVWSSHASSTVTSSSVTEITDTSTDTSTVPGSPASSSTSLSLAGVPIKDIKESQTKVDEEIDESVVTELDLDSRGIVTPFHRYIVNTAYIYATTSH